MRSPSLLHRLLRLSLVVLAACTSSDIQSGPSSVSGPALSESSEGRGAFQRYVAIGTSISMGVQSDGVYEATQSSSWPAQLASMAHRDLSLPLIQAPGCQSPLVHSIAANRRLSGESAASSSVCAPNVEGVTLPTGNVAIAAATTADALLKTPETTTSADYAGGRVYARVLASGQSQVSAMLAQNPKIVSVELGGNELLKARSGLVITGVTVVPYAVWSQAYDGVIAALRQSNAKYAVLFGLIDDATDFPAFRFGAEMWDARAEFARFYVRVSDDCMGSMNVLLSPVLVPTVVARGRAAAATGRPMPVFSCADVPGTVDYVLTPADVATVTAQSRRMSARIRSIADANGYAYFDLDALYAIPGLKAPFSVAALVFSTSPFGPYISLDGFHPTAAGQTLLAIAAARALNATYDMGIPLGPTLVAAAANDASRGDAIGLTQVARHNRHRSMATSR